MLRKRSGPLICCGLCRTKGSRWAGEHAEAATLAAIAALDVKMEHLNERISELQHSARAGLAVLGEALRALASGAGEHLIKI